jgi:hypothetical protein
MFSTQRLLAIGRGFALALCAAAIAVAAGAAEKSTKAGSGERLIGIIHVVPTNGIGFWNVGSRTFEADNWTRFEAFRVPMAIGNCAVVYLRGSRAVLVQTVDPEHC